MLRIDRRTSIVFELVAWKQCRIRLLPKPLAYRKSDGADRHAVQVIQDIIRTRVVNLGRISLPNTLEFESLSIHMVLSVQGSSMQRIQNVRRGRVSWSGCRAGQSRESSHVRSRSSHDRFIAKRVSGREWCVLSSGLRVCFQDHCKSRFATIDQLPRYIAAGVCRRLEG